MKKIIARIRNINFFICYPIAKEFIKFCFVGVTNLAVDILVYWFLTRAVDLYYFYAAVLSFVVAVTWSFLINRRWTFRHQGSDLGGQYIKFFVANLISMAINLSLFYLFVDYLNVYDLLAKALVAIIVVFFNFSLNKFWTFRPEAAPKTTV